MHLLKSVITGTETAVITGAGTAVITGTGTAVITGTGVPNFSGELSKLVEGVLPTEIFLWKYVGHSRDSREAG